MRFQGAHGRSPYCRDGQGGQEGEGEDHGRYWEEGRELKEGEATPKAKEMGHVRPTGGAARNLLTNMHHIGTWVARILADPRTLNQAVIVWEDEVPQREAEELGVRYAVAQGRAWKRLPELAGVAVEIEGWGESGF